jgi:Protein of unknown function (DUF998)
MAQIATTPTAVATPSRTNALLTAGVLAGPVFVLTVLAQALTRDGFDPRRHPLSLLALGDHGWIQITNFVACGVLAFASAFGLRRALRGSRAGTWGPILIGTYGVGLVWGGVFSADPAYGFPVGTPDGAPEQLSWHGALHGIAPALAAIALVAAAFVFARRFAAEGRRGWVAYCVGAVVADLGLTSVTFATDDYRWMLAGGIVIWTWAAAVTAHVLRNRA